MREVVESKRQLAAAESDYERMGWVVVDRTPDRSVLWRGKRGNGVWHILFFFLLPIFGNLIYAAFRRYNRPEQRVIRIQGFVDPPRKD